MNESKASRTTLTLHQIKLENIIQQQQEHMNTSFIWSKLLSFDNMRKPQLQPGK